jgi:RNA polymerase sigma-70 factor (ECF subfamily)
MERASAKGPDPEASTMQHELERLLQDELARLPDKYRLPLVYATVDGLDYASIGAMIGAPAGTVKTLVFRARQMLKERMKIYGA